MFSSWHRQRSYLCSLNRYCGLWKGYIFLLVFICLFIIYSLVWGVILSLHCRWRQQPGCIPHARHGLWLHAGGSRGWGGAMAGRSRERRTGWQRRAKEGGGRVSAHSPAGEDKQFEPKLLCDLNSLLTHRLLAVGPCVGVLESPATQAAEPAATGAPHGIQGEGDDGRDDAEARGASQKETAAGRQKGRGEQEPDDRKADQNKQGQDQEHEGEEVQAKPVSHDPLQRLRPGRGNFLPRRSSRPAGRGPPSSSGSSGVLWSRRLQQPEEVLVLQDWRPSVQPRLLPEEPAAGSERSLNYHMSPGRVICEQWPRKQTAVEDELKLYLHPELKDWLSSQMIQFIPSGS